LQRLSHHRSQLAKTVARLKLPSGFSRWFPG
jgi:hypothetical protein